MRIIYLFRLTTLDSDRNIPHMANTYKIKSRDEETYCKYCGCPLEVGNRVTENVAGDPFCSKTCAVIHDSHAAVPTEE